MIVKVRSHTVYQLKDGRYKCEVWYIDEDGETKRVTRTDPSKTVINNFAKDYPNEEFYPVCTLNEFFEEVYKKVLTDMKIGEALALTWNDIDLKNGTITVNKTSSEINLSEDGKTDYSIKIKTLSDKRTRVITITPEIEAILLLLRKQNPTSRFVISQRNGAPVSKSYISRVMRECIKDVCT